VSFEKIVAQLTAQGEPRSAVDPFIASLPQNVLSGAVARQERAFHEQAEEDAAAGKAAYEAEVAKAEAEWTSSLYAKTERYREGDPPAADELDVAGLSPLPVLTWFGSPPWWARRATRCGTWKQLGSAS
jgi:hypothetical protein